MSDKKSTIRGIPEAPKMSKVKRGIIDVHAIQFEGGLVFPAFQASEMFPTDTVETRQRIQELNLSHLLDWRVYGPVDNPKTVKQIVAATGAQKAEIDSFDRKNNEAWYLSNFVAYRYNHYSLQLRDAKHEITPHLIMQNSIGLGRLIEWWRWRSQAFEKSAIAEINRKAKSSSGSSKANTDKRQQRIESLLEEMEILVDENPVLSDLEPIQCAKAALRNAVENSPKLWAQGKGQLVEYLTILSSNEPYKVRYDALFHKTA